MDYMWLKLPIYFILFRKARQISIVQAELEKDGKLTAQSDFGLMFFMCMYCVVFMLLLLS